MALLNAICSRCKSEVPLDDSGKSGFCMKCGARMTVMDAAVLYQIEHPDGPPLSKGKDEQAALLDNLMLQAEAYLGQGAFDAAKSTYFSVVTREPTNWHAQWGLVLAETQNLEPRPIRHADDYAYKLAEELFHKASSSDVPEIEQWRAHYTQAFEQSCFMAIDAVDPRVFVETEIYRWYPRNNTFLYPVSRGFDLQPVFDKLLWEPWNELKNYLPPERHEEFNLRGEDCCQKIWDYFDLGFANMEDLRNGNLNRLMGTWHLRLTTGAIKSDVLKFTINNASIPHLETCRLKFNHYDYYRFVKMDSGGYLLAGEHRHFPSSLGMGGDFVSFPQYEAVMSIMAIYDYTLVLPTALYMRTDPKTIEGYDRALAYQQKCRVMPCFQRHGVRHAIQVCPIVENHDTVDATKKVSACYIATAVYGDEDAPQVLRLRRFRDERLHATAWGRRLSTFYYRHSPKLAARLRGRKILNGMVRRLLNGLIRLLR